MNSDVDLRQAFHRILIVDDEEKICLNCVKILSRMDCTAEYALNGYDALKRLEIEPYDLVITDLKMSSLGGMEVLRRVKESFPETVVIVITGYSTVSSAVEVMKSGAFDYLPKPFTPYELRAVVMQALAERDLRLQNAELTVQNKSRRTVSHQLRNTRSACRPSIRRSRSWCPRPVLCPRRLSYTTSAPSLSQVRPPSGDAISRIEPERVPGARRTPATGRPPAGPAPRSAL